MDRQKVAFAKFKISNSNAKEIGTIFYNVPF